MIYLQTIEKEALTNIENMTFNLKNLNEDSRMAYELCDFIVEIDRSIKQSLIFKLLMSVINITLN